MKKNFFLTLFASLFAFTSNVFADDFTWEITPAPESQLEEISSFQIKFSMDVIADWPESIVIYRNGVVMKNVSVKLSIGSDNRTCTYTLNKPITEEGTYSIRHLDWSVMCEELGEDLPEIEIIYYIGEPQELEPVLYLSPQENTPLTSLSEVQLLFENVKEIEIDSSKRVEMLSEGQEEGEGREYFIEKTSNKSVSASPVVGDDDPEDSGVIRKRGTYTLCIEDGAILLDEKPYGAKFTFTVIEDFLLLECSPAEGSTVSASDLEKITLTFNKNVVGFTSFMLQGLKLVKIDAEGNPVGDVGFYKPTIDKEDARKVILAVDEWGLDIEEDGTYALNIPPTAFISEDGDKNLIASITYNVGEKQTGWTFDKPIYELPEGGDYKLYNRSSQLIYYTMNGLVMASDEYYAGEVYFYDNGDVYLRNMIPSMASGSFLKGRLEGNKIVMQFPQGLCYDEPYYDENGNLVTDAVWPVFRAKYEIGKFWDDEYEKYVEGIDAWVDQENQTITFSINDDGSITQDDQDCMIGVFTSSGTIWYSEGAWNYVYQPFNEKPLVMPEGLEPEDWAFYDNNSAAMTKVAYDGDDFYWKGAYPSLPESVVKGHVEGNKIVLESPVYLGIDPNSFYLAYFAGTEEANNRLSIINNPKLNYNAEEMIIAYPHKHLIVNAGPEKVNVIRDFSSPTLKYQGGEIIYAKPRTPEINWVSEWEKDWATDSYSWFTVVSIPNVDVNGNLLDINRMWYNFYFDDEIYWFDKDDYGLVHDATDVPYDWNDDWNIYYRGGFDHYIYFYWTGYQKMEIESVFEDEDGNIYRSDRAEYINYTGIDDVEHDEQQPSSVAYFDILGRRINKPSGLCIKQATYPDGSVRTTKILRK